MTAATGVEIVKEPLLDTPLGLLVSLVVMCAVLAACIAPGYFVLIRTGRSGSKAVRRGGGVAGALLGLAGIVATPLLVIAVGDRYFPEEETSGPPTTREALEEHYGVEFRESYVPIEDGHESDVITPDRAITTVRIVIDDDRVHLYQQARDHSWVELRPVEPAPATDAHGEATGQ